MATILFSAAGAALGSGFGGTVLGLSGAVIGRAVGATLGRAIDQRILGLGAEPVEVGRLDRFYLMGASEGAPVSKVWGRMRVPGQVIWASPYLESQSSSGGGKGAPRPRTVQFSYSVSLAVALCAGEILGIGRIWADGTEIAPNTLDLRLYKGTEDQLPDPAIEADVGFGRAPAYRGCAYVVLENLDLSAFGNRVPQLSFEVLRTAQGLETEQTLDLQKAIRAVAIIPGTGEYALATEKVRLERGFAETETVNANSRSGEPDFVASLGQLRRELPNCTAASLIVSWFGNDLRCGSCEVRPKVEQLDLDAASMPWRAGGIGRAQAGIVPKDVGRSIYGGTPSDASVVQAIKALRDGGQTVMFYPFILMEQLGGNSLTDPYSGEGEQPALPWRGRITLSAAPGREGSPDMTTGAVDEVASFFGTTAVGDFTISGDDILYTGPLEWGYRRFILHYAHLCQLAGGVDAFCIGSEMRGLTQIRGPGHSFPAVQALIQLAADVRSILGPYTEISYAADWSEYFGYHVNGNVYFHLDPLWASSDIDFIGIDNYMPLSDWRSGYDHADAHWNSIYNLNYLKSNICGGEGFDWYYDSPEGIDYQLRKPIEDGLFGEPWVFRVKDLRSWWGHTHHNRIDGLRSNSATEWIPRSKPIRFTEYGCSSIDNGTNEPNRFLDPKSSESALPRASEGIRDDYIQMQYYRAMVEYWKDPENNPISEFYNGPMLDLGNCFAWAWDARPYPDFPRNEGLWSDGSNYLRGHWLNGRATSAPLDAVVREICETAGLKGVETGHLHGLVHGYVAADIQSARAALQPLGITYAFDAIERDGKMHFVSRSTATKFTLTEDKTALGVDLDRSLELTRLSEAEISGRARFGYVSADGEFDVRIAEAVFPSDDTQPVSQTEYPISLPSGAGKSIAERWLAEARSARDVLKVRLPNSLSNIGAGSLVSVAGATYRIDGVELDDARTIEAVRMERSHYELRDAVSEVTDWVAFRDPAPVAHLWLDLPLLKGTELPHAPYIAAIAKPWPGPVAVWSAEEDAGYELDLVLESQSIVGTTLTPLKAAHPGLIDRGAPLRVKFLNGEIASTSLSSMLSGLNVMAIGDGTKDYWEVFQFQEATLVDLDTYEISLRIRGQAGTEALMPEIWPVGSYVVLLGSGIRQVSLNAQLRGVDRHYRVGASALGLENPEAQHDILAFKGNGLRPYTVAHLKVVKMLNGDFNLGWVRRTRIDGDGWDAADVPLGEDRESYSVTIKNFSGSTVRTFITDEAGFVYSTAEQLLDGVAAAFSVEVAQLSSIFGAGPAKRLFVTI
ncbi:MAG: glycoside hydrolase TIM-barrel-like domain-containing protein [Rhodobacteraceae bacterium]|nr:glycoside hydrolase TIM-barrel-like domain-containing protein [Paracoccaceae bacterium]MCF8513946.1 glycoside hydrolase TIM-barrel-like domain-containing protein [Paracoccaceae bacterium]MCF8518190.1 glycoside hydrolase TIM-barrel-like domain-containing protein [Paracoccaceae bacterium]